MDPREIQPSLGNDRAADSGQIKAEIDQTRERIDDTLEALGEKLHPKHLLDEAVDYLRSPRQMSGTASKLGQSVWHQIQAHPMPSLLIGAGLVWMLSEHRNTVPNTARSDTKDTGNDSTSFPESAGRLAHSVTEKTAALGQSVKEKTGELVQSVREKSGEIADTIKEKTHAIKEKGVEQAIRLKEATTNMSTQTQERAGAVMHWTGEKLSEVAHDYPLAIGFGFLAIGVLAGLALPHSGLEDRTLGHRADELKEKMRDGGREAVETVQRTASAVASATTEEAQKQGLTAHNLGEKIQHVVSDVANAAADAAHREGVDQDSITSQVKSVAGEAKRAAQEELEHAKERMTQRA